MPDLENELSFDDITVENALGVPIEAPATEEPEVIQPAIIPAEPEAEPEEEAPEEVAEEEPETPKVEGIKEVREAYTRAARREKELDESLTKINSVFEELGGTADDVAEAVREYGGIEQLKVGTQIYKLVTDNANDAESLLKQANEIIPETTEALVLYIADAVEKDLSATYQQRLFGREITDAELQKVRDVLDFGTTTESKIPAELLVDEFGEPLPERTQAAVKAMWERNRASEQKLTDLTSRIDKQLNTIDSSQVTQARDTYISNAFSSVVEMANKLGLNEAEDKAQAQADFTVLETLSFKFFSQNPAADRAMNDAIKTLGKTDAASKAKHADASRLVVKFAKVAAEKAASYIAPRSAAKAQKASAASTATGTVVKGGSSQPSKPAAKQQADDWGDITVQSVTPILNLKGRGRRR